MGSVKKSSASALVKFTVLLLGMSALLNLYSTQPILNEIASWADIEATDAGWTISMSTAGVALTAPFAGLISDRFGRRKIIIYALVLMTILTALGLVVSSYQVLLVLRFVQGACCPFVFAVTVAYLNDEFNQAVAIRLNALYVAGTALGGFAGRMSSAVILDYFGHWKLSLAGNTLILAIIFAVTLCGLPKEKNFQPSLSRQPGTSILVDIVTLISSKSLLATIFIGGTLLFQQVASFTFGSLMLASEPFSLSASVVGLIFVVFLIPTVTTPTLGKVTAKYGPIKGFVFSQAIGIVGLLLTLVPFVPMIVLGLALSCIGVFGGQSAGTLMMGRLGAKARSTAVGLYLTGYYLGGAFGAVVPSPIYRNVGWAAVVACLVITAVVSAALAALSWRSYEGMS